MAAVESREGRYTFRRVAELQLDPVKGSFDVAHLREVHRRIFQDLAHHRPGEFRPDAPGHVKNRVLESTGERYTVPYALRRDIDARIGPVLDQLRGGAELKGLDPAAFTQRMAKLYGDLDQLHPFSEGNSRTLRAFTSQLAREAGYQLDWGTTSVSAISRDNLYMARDWAVITRTYPGLAGKRIDAIADRAEMAAYTTLGTIQRADRMVEIVRQSVDLGQDRKPGARVITTADLSAEIADLIPAARHQARYDAESARIAALRDKRKEPQHAAAQDRLAWFNGPTGPERFVSMAKDAGPGMIVYDRLPGARAIDRLAAIGSGIEASRTKSSGATPSPAEAAREFLRNSPAANLRDGRFRDAQEAVRRVGQLVASREPGNAAKINRYVAAATRDVAERIANGQGMEIRRTQSAKIDRNTKTGRERER